MRKVALSLLALAVLVTALGFWLLRPDRTGSQAVATTTTAGVAPALLAPLAGSGSCAGRSCHGGIDPAQGPAARFLMNEHTIWVRDDPHAGAYDTLLKEESQAIAGRLGIGPAQKSPRCLACHTTPEAAPRQPDTRVEEFVQHERALGVGCESCHGNARQWINPHLRADWSKKGGAEKKNLGMIDVADAAALAARCAGCHVGAPPTVAAPVARDVNHDLIAAGHPRLAFEFSAFFANLPAHWKRAEFPEVQRWATGQVVTAEAALRLLEYRSHQSAGTDDARVWPEFAEYDCFGCHHNLTDASWRQKREPRPGRKRDALSWGSWYFAMPRSIAEKEISGLAALVDLMEKPLPARAAVRAQVAPALVELKDVKDAIAGWENSQQFARTKRNALLVARRPDQESNWDAAEQTYLSLCALNRAANDPAFDARLAALLNDRAFMPGLGSPLSQPRDGFIPSDFFKALRGAGKKAKSE
jgi:hypothetical protein